MGSVKLEEKPEPPRPPPRSRKPWIIVVARYAEEQGELEAFEPLTEASRRLAEEYVNGSAVHAVGRVEKNGLLYAVEVEGDTLEEALEKAGKAVRALDEILLLYR